MGYMRCRDMLFYSSYFRNGDKGFRYFYKRFYNVFNYVDFI